MDPSQVKRLLKRFYFSALGKDPRGVVAVFLTGRPELCRRMVEEVREILPEYRQVTVGLEGSGADVVVEKSGAAQLHCKLRRLFRRQRVVMAPVLFDGTPETAALRRAACFLAPTRILAYNQRLERHHLRLSTALASLLFLRGVPVDRIYLRPWRRPPRHASITALEGRPLTPGRPRVAVLTPYFPYPLSHGGAVRIFNLLKEAAREFDIFLFAITEDRDQPEYQPVLELCTRVVLASKPPYREPRWSSLQPPEVREYALPELRQAILKMTREFGIRLLQTEYTMLASYGGDILVEHDVTFDLYSQIHVRERSLGSWWNLWRWRRYERRAVERFARVIVMSDKDAALLRAPNVEIIPNGVDLSRFQPKPERSGERLLFVGSFRHFPNIQAVQFFMDQVWPSLAHRHPNAELTIVGGPDHLLHWDLHTGGSRLPEHPRVRLLGFERDVRPLYEETNLVIVPTTVSAGTNLKVLEAMAMQRAVVSTPSGCAGLGLEHGRSVWVAQTPEEFADGISMLLQNPQRRAAIAAEARRLAVDRYDWLRIAALQTRLWRELLGD